MAAPATPVAWIDTNVMVEVFSFGDFLGELVEWDYLTWTHRRRAQPDFLRADARRKLVQGSLWMTMALCTQRATTISYLHETSRALFRLAPPDSQLALPTVAVLRVLVPGGVFDGWERVETNDGAHLMTTDERDHFMADECHRRGIALVSRDKNARKYAHKVGVAHAVTPEEYARNVISWEDARLMFLRRLDLALLWAAHQSSGFPLLHGLTGDEDWDHDHVFLRHLRDVLRRYEGSWEWCWKDKAETR